MATQVIATWILVLLAPCANAIQSFSGQLPSGAYYKIEAPDNWRAGDPVALYQHGFSMNPPTSNIELGPLKDLQLSQGFAVAATSYRMRGWALFKSTEDNLELLAMLKAKIGEAGDIYTFGGSMGGLIAIKMAEHPELINKVKGIYSVCPVAGGARAWDQALDVRLIYDAVCKDVGGGELPRGAEPFPWATNLNDIPNSLGSVQSSDELARLAARMNQCFGYGLPDLLRSDNQKQRRDKLMQLTGVTEENWLAVQIGYAAFALGDLVRDPQKLNGRSPVRSVLTYDSGWGPISYSGDGSDGCPAGATCLPLAEGEQKYCANSLGVPSIQSALQGCENRLDVRSVTADPEAAFQLSFQSDLTGTSSAPILSLHTSRDQLVPSAHQSELRVRYNDGHLASIVIAEEQSSHCGFSRPELTTGWNALRNWRAGGVQPTAQTLQSLCVSGGASQSDCRFSVNDSESNVPPLSMVIRSRFELYPNRISGAWFNPSRSGEGIFLEEVYGHLESALGNHRKVLMTYYTYDGQPKPPMAQQPAGQTRGQRWLIGVGDIYENGIYFPLLQDASGARFGSAFNAGNVRLKDQARARILFDPPFFSRPDSNWANSVNSIRLEFENTGDEWVDAPTQMEQLSVLGVRRESGILLGLFGAGLSPLNRGPMDARSGTYFNPNRSGEGITLTQFGPSSAFSTSSVPNPDLRSLLVWYTYDTQGNQLWLIGEGTQTSVNRIRFDMLRTRGPTYASFDPNVIQRIPWGTIELEASGCNVTAMTYSAIDPTYGTGRIELSRLTNPTPTNSISCPYQ